MGTIATEPTVGPLVGPSRPPHGLAASHSPSPSLETTNTTPPVVGPQRPPSSFLDTELYGPGRPDTVGKEEVDDSAKDASRDGTSTAGLTSAYPSFHELLASRSKTNAAVAAGSSKKSLRLQGLSSLSEMDSMDREVRKRKGLAASSEYDMYGSAVFATGGGGGDSDDEEAERPESLASELGTKKVKAVMESTEEDFESHFKKVSKIMDEKAAKKNGGKSSKPVTKRDRILSGFSN